MSQIKLNGRPVKLENIDSYQPENAFEKSFFSFISAWVRGQEEFKQQTSGSTGTPKTIVIKRKQMIASAKMTCRALNLQPGYTALVCLDTEYIAGKMMIVRALENNMPIIANTPSTIPFKDIEEPIDFAAFVPMQLGNLVEVTAYSSKLNGMKAIIIGGAEVGATLQTKIQSIKAPVFATYGMTETVSHIALKKLNKPFKEDYYKAFEEVQLSTDPRGCLVVKSALSGNKQITTNDVVNLKDNQQFEWLGRIDNVINTGGVKVHPEKIELAISHIFSQKNISNRYFIHGLKDEILGKKVVLFIEGEQFDTVGISAQFNQSLDKYQIPKEYIFIDQFAETENGKLNRSGSIALVN